MVSFGGGQLCQWSEENPSQKIILAKDETSSWFTQYHTFSRKQFYMINIREIDLSPKLDKFGETLSLCVVSSWLVKL